MTKDEMFQKNLTLSTEFNKYLLEHPDMVEKIPQDAHLIFLPEDDMELREANERLAGKLKSRGERVVYIEIERVPDTRGSRLVSPRVVLSV